MADQMTSTSSSTEDDRRDEINAKLDEVRELMVANGMAADAADAALFSARQGVPVIIGNFADLNRLGAIMVTGVLPTPAGTPDVSTDDMADAFPEPKVENPRRFDNEIPVDSPVAIATADMVEEGKVGGRGPGGVEGPTSSDKAVDTATTPATETTAETDTGLSGMTKAQLLDEAALRGVQADDSMTKAQILAALGG